MPVAKIHVPEGRYDEARGKVSAAVQEAPAGQPSTRRPGNDQFTQYSPDAIH
jgi:hypothetical protein